MNDGYIVTVGGTRNVDNVQSIAKDVSLIINDVFKDRTVVNHTFADDRLGGDCHVQIFSDLSEKQIRQVFSMAFSGHDVRVEAYRPEKHSIKKNH